MDGRISAGGRPGHDALMLRGIAVRSMRGGPASAGRGRAGFNAVVVQRFCKPKVGGSNPSPGTRSQSRCTQRVGQALG